MAVTKLLPCLAALALALLWHRLVSSPPRPTDPLVARVSDRFQSLLDDGDRSSPRIRGRGVLNWDLDTFVWNRFAEKFGSNPNTPYMYGLLPLGGFLPSPMWRMRRGDAVVLIFRPPPLVEYFSFTTFCLASWKRGFVFSSLGDSLNSRSKLFADASDGDLFALVAATQGSAGVLERVRDALERSGVPREATHVAVVPDALAEDDRFAFYEVVLRLFRFENQTKGEEYLRSKQPVFYVAGSTADSMTDEAKETLAAPVYRDRHHLDSVNEPALYESALNVRRSRLVEEMNQTFESSSMQQIDFSPLHIVGLECLENVGSQCLGDCPDAAYFGSNIDPVSNDVASLTLPTDDEFHLVAAIDHKRTESSIYSSVALLRANEPTLDKTRLDVRATSVGVLSNREYHLATKTDTDDGPFFSWVITRNPEHCRRTRQYTDGCTVIDEAEVPRKSYLAYCERLYLNPVTGTGPNWGTILPARIFHFRDVKPRRVDLAEYKRKNAALFERLRLPPPKEVDMRVFQGEESLKFLHIVKTGGESLERYLWNTPTAPRMDYAHCRSVAAANLTASLPSVPATSCWAMASAIGTLLCGLNCECCAGDFGELGGFRGTLIRSPRSYLLSLFSHGHQAHHTTWRRAASDVPLYAAEGALRAAEALCGHSGTGGAADWRVALEDNLRASPSTDEGVHVISLWNPQSHALTCGKSSRGGMGQHFRILPAVDAQEPSPGETLAALRRMNWVGLTDLFHDSLCLLHYQFNRTMPAEDCDCRHPRHHTNDPARKPLGHWVEGRTTKRSIEDVSEEVIDLIDAHTGVDAEAFAAALLLVLSRLRRAEELTGYKVLECIDWQKLKQSTDYIPGLWSGGPQSLLHGNP